MLFGTWNDPKQVRFPGFGGLRPGGRALVAVVLIGGCGTIKSEQDPTGGWSAERLYQDARTEISAGNWNDARTRLEAVESRYPFGGYAQQSLIDQAYVNWKDAEPEQALAAIHRFQQQYPTHPGRTEEHPSELQSLIRTSNHVLRLQN